jgi:hypothetical protein
MRSVAGGLILAVVLFGAGAAFWSEARLTRRMADARLRLATLHYDADDGIDEGASLLSRLPVAVGARADDVDRYRTTVAYWQARYRDLAGRLPTSGGNTADATADPEVLLVAANASFRSAKADMSDRPATVERLDRVIQAYADVLRLASDSADASYNYEYVARFRDTFARSRPARKAGAEKPAPPPDATSGDLPAGPTVHGRPGGPPEDIPMEQFRTITPMRFEEREETEPGQGAAPRRKG